MTPTEQEPRLAIQRLATTALEEVLCPAPDDLGLRYNTRQSLKYYAQKHGVKVTIVLQGSEHARYFRVTKKEQHVLKDRKMALMTQQEFIDAFDEASIQVADKFYPKSTNRPGNHEPSSGRRGEYLRDQGLLCALLMKSLQDGGVVEK